MKKRKLRLISAIKKQNWELVCLLPESTGWAWLLQVKDFLGTEVKEECGKVELSLREWFDKLNGDESLIFEVVRNEDGLVVTEGMVLMAWLEKVVAMVKFVLRVFLDEKRREGYVWNVWCEEGKGGFAIYSAKWWLQREKEYWVSRWTVEEMCES